MIRLFVSKRRNGNARARLRVAILGVVGLTPVLACAPGMAKGSVGAPHVAEQTICDEPATLTPGRAVDVGTFRAELPGRYGIAESDGEYRLFRSGNRFIGLERGSAPHMLAPDETSTIQSSCTANIGGRLVEIRILKATFVDAPMTPSGVVGPHFIAAGRWNSVSNGQDVVVWINSPYREDLMSLRSVFWTVRFPDDSTGKGGR